MVACDCLAAWLQSWWDYGYQMSGMANRTVFVDNNTWNNTHIATVGRAMASNEEDSYPIMHSLDVDYVLVIFGGLTGYQSDDINKFLWMVRIGGGVFPHIKESDYFADGQYRMDKVRRRGQRGLMCLCAPAACRAIVADRVYLHLLLVVLMMVLCFCRAAPPRCSTA